MTQLGPILTNAIAYWEPRRVLYNLVLVGVTLRNLEFFCGPPLLELFVLAVLANACYCAAYLIDVPVQLSEFRARWLPHRWLLWLLGTAFAAALAYLTLVHCVNQVLG